MKRKRIVIVIVALLCCALAISSAAQSVVRVGVIDSRNGALANGARLAAKAINAAGGFIGADGSAHELQIVVSAPDDMDIAVANMRQASVIGVIGPAMAADLRDNLTALQALNAPVLSPAADDGLLRRDESGRVFRAIAAERALNRALARYLAGPLRANSIVTVQLDAASTSSLIGFVTAIAEVGASASNLLYDEARLTLGAIGRGIAEQGPDAVVIYGPPLLAAQSYNLIREDGFGGTVAYNQAAEPDFRDFVPAAALDGIISAVAWSPAIQGRDSQRFLLDYSAHFGELPEESAAAAYDALFLLARAFRTYGDMSENLAAIRALDGVQGRLSPHQAGGNQTGLNSAITRLNANGAPVALARFDGDAPISGDESLVRMVTATPAPSPTPDGVFLTVRSALQNVRSGPSTQYPVIGQLSAGATKRVLAQNPEETWFVINLDGQFGWMAAYLVDTWRSGERLPVMQAPATPTPLPSATPPPPPEADLIITGAYPQRLTLDGQSVAQVTVRNQGRAAAGPFAVAASLMPGARYASYNLPGLGGGQHATVQLVAALAGPTGPQAVIIVADLNEEVYEGPYGEANNHVYVYHYIADRAIARADSWTGGAGGLDVDGNGAIDLMWTGSDLLALNGALYVMPGFQHIDQTHYDAIRRDMAGSGAVHVDRLRNAVIGFFTETGARGVVQVRDVIRNGVISLDFRLYR